MAFPRYTAVLLCCALLTGCPGELEILPDQGAATPDMPQGDTIIIGGGKDTMMAPMPEGGMDLTGAGDKGVAPDLLPPDLSLTPDQAGTPADQGTPTGGKCPCKSGQYCVNNGCRNPCKVPTDPCKVISNCPAAEACVETNKTGLWVCLPGHKAGQACSSTYFCLQKHICAQVVGTPGYRCLPVCSSAGAKCGASGAGICLQSSGGCMFCSAP